MSHMLKGCQRKMVVVRGRDKGAFETAYFVLRRESERKSFRDGELLEEANRIINEQQIPRERTSRGRGHTGLFWLSWIAGVLLGSGGTILLGVLLR